MDHDDFLKLSMEMKKLTDERKVPFIINDDVEIAIECDAEGLHIGQGDMAASEARKKIGEDKILGVSVSTVEEALKAEAEGADYLGVGAMFTTSTKDDAESVKPHELKEIVESVSIPVVAIGGIDENNILELDRTGIYGVAAVSSILGREDIKKATNTMVEKSNTLVHDTVRMVLSKSCT
jgi:thiamine-phosphate diphosphorylase